ncbi:hypothetical protein HPB51_024200 [Rhipicephalus microplus]|uniref:Uncharacterized protein n=1 Tax=Rhipicephalus microplus TaxID=6941 RepID=A0A9J6DX19_RHIMP|nr:hypothetical protein HPB51_024200 [Rhipicephalus microplus]
MRCLGRSPSTLHIGRAKQELCARLPHGNHTHGSSRQGRYAIRHTWAVHCVEASCSVHGSHTTAEHARHGSRVHFITPRPHRLLLRSGALILPPCSRLTAAKDDDDGHRAQQPWFPPVCAYVRTKSLRCNSIPRWVGLMLASFAKDDVPASSPTPAAHITGRCGYAGRRRRGTKMAAQHAHLAVICQLPERNCSGGPGPPAGRQAREKRTCVRAIPDQWAELPVGPREKQMQRRRPGPSGAVRGV